MKIQTYLDYKCKSSNVETTLEGFNLKKTLGVAAIAGSLFAKYCTDSPEDVEKHRQYLVQKDLRNKEIRREDSIQTIYQNVVANHFKFLKVKELPTTFYSQKNAGLNDVMELYLYDFKKYPVFDKQAFSNFCKDKSSKFKGVWLYIVVFDNDKYAEFNQYPLSTQFDLGLDDDKVNIQIKHIKAIYRYNTKNEYVDIEYPNS